MAAVSAELLRRLRQGKTELRQARRSAPLDVKLRELVRAQYLYVQIAGSRRQLKPWQKPWNILSDVRDSIAIGGNPTDVQPIKLTTGSSRSDWVRPTQPWVFGR